MLPSPIASSSFDLVHSWVKEYRKEQLKPAQDGIINEATGLLAAIVGEHLNDPSRAETLTFGSKSAASLTLHTAASTTGVSAVTTQATSSLKDPPEEVDQAERKLLEAAIKRVLDSLPAVKSPTQKIAEPLMKREMRMKVAAKVIEKCGLVRGKEKDAYCCGICYRPKGMTVKWKNRHHKQLGGMHTLGINTPHFCPFADDPVIFDNLKEPERLKNKEINDRKYQRKKERAKKRGRNSSPGNI